MDIQNKKISLVLGSGGARGITQIGVIQYLEEKGFEIYEIVGCSIGSLVGGAFACGQIYSLGDWMKKLTKAQVFRLMDFSNPRYGLLKGDRVLNTLHEVFADTNIEALPLKYLAVATDLQHEEEVVFDSGSVYAAIRASMAIPGVFTAVKMDDRFLVDGGVLNPVPVNHVSKRNNLVVTVNLDGIFEKNGADLSTLSSFSVLQESYFAMRRRLSRLTLELYKPDYVINIPRSIAGIWDYHRSSELIEIGYGMAENVMNGQRAHELS